MSPKEPTRHNHHFVSEFILAKFVRPDGKLFCYNKQFAWTEINVKPKTIGYERHLYKRFLGIDLNEDIDSVEKWFSDKIENPAAPPLKKLVDGHCLQSLSEEETHSLANLIVLQDAKTPKARDFLLPMFKEAGLEANRDDRFTQKQLIRKGQYFNIGEIRRIRKRGENTLMSALTQSAWIDSFRQWHHRARLTIKEMLWSVVTSEDGCHFITSDVAIAKFSGGFETDVPWSLGNRLGVDHWVMPISPTKAIALSYNRIAIGPIVSCEFVQIVNNRLALDTPRYIFSSQQIQPNTLPR